MEIVNPLSLFRAPSGKKIKRVRVSTLSRYFWCSPQAWMSALGVENPPSDILKQGTEIHTAIETARKLNSYEKEFSKLIGNTYASDKKVALSRTLKDTNTKVELGEIVTHGIDGFKVNKDKEVDLIEYKTKGGWRVYPVSLMPAIFQTKVYMWVLDPLIREHGYTWRHTDIVFVKRDRRRRAHFEPIGETRVEDYDSIKVENKILEILDEWDRASKAKTSKERRDILIPPKSYKCRFCPSCYKNGENKYGLRCPFQDE